FSMLLQCFLIEAVTGGALFDAGRLAAAVAQVVKLRAAHGTVTHDFDAVDNLAPEREYALNAFAVADLADGEAFVDAGTGACCADAFVSLDTLALAFF